jgi:hypothetical protein
MYRNLAQFWHSEGLKKGGNCRKLGEVPGNKKTGKMPVFIGLQPDLSWWAVQGLNL